MATDWEDYAIGNMEYLRRMQGIMQKYVIFQKTFI